jgi:hypothetical protein
MSDYKTPESFSKLFYDFTGYAHGNYPADQRAIAKDLSETLAAHTTVDDSGPLVVADSKGIYVYDSKSGHPLITAGEYRAAPNSGFYEVTGISHVGPAMAYLGVLQTYGNDIWQQHLAPMKEHMNQIREVNAASHEHNWLTQLDCPAWRGHEAKIQKLIDYACALGSAYLEQVETNLADFCPEHITKNFLEIETEKFPIPYNTVMIATFSLAGLQSAYDIYTSLTKVDINWQNAKVLLHNLAGTNYSAGLTARSNWLHPLIKAIAGDSLSDDRIFIVPYAPEFDGLGNEKMSDKQYDVLANQVWGGIYSRPIVMNQAFGKIPDIDTPERPPIPGDYGFTKADQIDHFLQRLKFSTGNIKEMLSNTVGFWLAGEAHAKNWDLSKMAIPGLTHGLPQGLTEYPTVG